MSRIWVELLTVGLLVHSTSAADLVSIPLQEGFKAGLVSVVIYEDLECPDCAFFQPTLDSVIQKYKGRVTFIHKDFPLIRHNWAREAAVASRFFATRNVTLALNYRHSVLASQSKIINEANFLDHLRRFADEHGVRPASALNGLKDPRFEAIVQADCVEGVRAHIEHTPTVLVGSKRFVERIGAEELSLAIDAELAAQDCR